MFSRLNHPVVTALITAVFYFIFLVFTLNQRDPGTFPHAGDFFTDVNEAPTNLIVLTDSFGYDGQFYYRIALNPLTREKTEFGIEIDSPRYRHQRILYPALAWVFSFGNPLMVTNSLILINYLALIAIGYTAGQYAKMSGRHAIWGLAFSLYPGFLLTLSRDLAEITEATLILAGMVALERNQTTIASAWFSLAIFAKETALITAVSLISQKKNWSVAILPLLVYGAWQLFLNRWWGYLLGKSLNVNLGWPLLGIIQGFEITNNPERWLIEIILLGVFFLSVLFSLQRSKADQYVKVNWVLYLILLLVLTKHVWVEDWAFLRVATLGFILGTAVLLKSRTWIAIVCFIGTIATWLWLAIDILQP